MSTTRSRPQSTTATRTTPSRTRPPTRARMPRSSAISRSNSPIPTWSPSRARATIPRAKTPTISRRIRRSPRISARACCRWSCPRPRSARWRTTASPSPPRRVATRSSGRSPWMGRISRGRPRPTACSLPRSPRWPLRLTIAPTASKGKSSAGAKSKMLGHVSRELQSERKSDSPAGRRRLPTARGYPQRRHADTDCHARCCLGQDWHLRRYALIVADPRSKTPFWSIGDAAIPNWFMLRIYLDNRDRGRAS